MYYVVAGTAKFEAGAKVVEVKHESILFVAALEKHRFFDVEKDLKVLVFFSKAPVESDSDK